MADEVNDAPANKPGQLRKWGSADLDRASEIVPAKLEPLALATVGPQMRDMLTASTDTEEREVPED
jgi:hypothetical protein